MEEGGHLVKALLIIFLIPLQSFSQISISAESFQLQQLINKSEEQLKLLRESIKNNKQDADYVERAYLILERLSAGIDKTIESHKGTQVYTDALLKLQSNENSKNTYSDSQAVRLEAAKIINSSVNNKQDFGQSLEGFIEFQKKSVEANNSDLIDQGNLRRALSTSEPGFVPKIQALVQLGSWQTNTRLSAQNTELLAAIQSVREELRILRMQKSGSDALGTILIGSEIQNQKQRDKDTR